MILTQALLILGFTYAGEVIQTLTQANIPGNIIGLGLLFGALQFKIVKLESLELISTWLKNNLAFFFVPITVQLMVFFDLLEMHWFNLTLILIVSTVITYLATAYAAQWGEKK